MIKTFASAVVVFVALVSFSTVNHADETWAQKHPRRAQVNRRNNRQKNRINNAAANGKLTQGQANRDTRQENAIHNQEKADAAANGGHITKGEQNQINHEQNQMNQKIDRQENRDASQPAPAGQ